MNKIKSYKLFESSKLEDPYGEEIWESAGANEKLPLYYLKPTKQIIKGDEILELYKKDDLINFKTDFKGWLKISPKYKNYMFNVTDIKIHYDTRNYILSIRFNEYFDSNEQHHLSGSSISIILNESTELQKFIVVIPTNNTNSYIDPFGEEDWDWDLF